MNTEVTVVIPALNVASTIGEQLEGLASQDFDGDWEVIVADNGSTDGTRAVVEGFVDRLPSLRIVDASARRGVNHARNQGARAARGSLILFCDGDDIVTTGWVRSMVHTLRTYDAAGGPLQRFGRSNENSYFDPLNRGPRFLPYPIGASCGVKRDVWMSLGGFDEDYDGRASDEIEFFWRLQLAGFRLGNSRDAIVHYRMPPKPNLRKNFRNGRESVRLHRDFHHYGYTGPSVGALRGWSWIISRAPLALISTKHRKYWVRRLATHAGRAAGTVKYRHLLL
jgi:glycosyltransferase involved in cell wall biosynthesis